MNRAKNLLKEEYLTIQKRWEYWFYKAVFEERDEEVDALEKFWRETLFRIKDLIKDS
jgi:hypothetical protein